MTRILVALALCLTAGLAPYVPEPHLWGKLKWMMGGGAGMSSEDIVDVALHGTPWLWLLFELGRAGYFFLKKRETKP